VAAYTGWPLALTLPWPMIVTGLVGAFAAFDILESSSLRGASLASDVVILTQYETNINIFEVNF